VPPGGIQVQVNRRTEIRRVWAERVVDGRIGGDRPGAADKSQHDAACAETQGVGQRDIAAIGQWLAVLRVFVVGRKAKGVFKLLCDEHLRPECRAEERNEQEDKKGLFHWCKPIFVVKKISPKNAASALRR
jgi:hypothetical protein